MPKESSQRSPLSADQQVHMLAAFAKATIEKRTLRDFLWLLVSKVGELFEFEDCVVYLRRGEALEQVAAYGVKNRHSGEISVPVVVPVGDGIVGTVAMTGRSEMVPDTRNDSRYIADQFEGRSELAVPILFEGEVLGVIDTESSFLSFYLKEDQQVLETVANVLAGKIAWLSSEGERRTQEEKQRTERLDALGRLGGGVAHDFNNVLALLAGNIELARESQAEEERLECLTSMERAVSKGISITQQLQVFAVGGTPQLEFMRIEKLVAEALEALEDFPHIECTVSVEADLPRVQGDRLQLLRMMSNLLVNAAQSMRSRGRIEFGIYSAFARGPEVVVRVTDHGSAIDPADEKRIFEPYFRRRDAGQGLGVAAAYWIATRNGGDLCLLTSEEGNVFEAHFPAMRGDIAVPETGPVLGQIGPLRILILDDEAGMRQVLGSLLRRRGHEVEAVADGSEVLSVWRLAAEREQPFDVVLLDLSIPGGIGGLEALELLRQADPKVRAIVMSGYSDDPVLSAFEKYGFAARLRKPFDASQLEYALEKVLES